VSSPENSIVNENSSETMYGTRRKSRAVALLFFLSATVAGGALGQNPTTELRIGIVTPRGTPTSAEVSTLQGIRLGAAEASQTAKLFGDIVDLYEADGDAKTPGARQAAAFLSSRRKVQILIGIAPADADPLARFAEEHGVIFLNVSSRSDALRGACRPNSFHIEATDAAYANVSHIYSRGATPRRAAKVPTPGDSVVLWDSRLERFGAIQLNDRYRTASHSAMNGGAWAGWAAIKIAAEAALRAQSTDPSRIRAYLEAPTTKFDGHKGWPLSFRPLDHQLRQPLYIVARAKQTRPIDVPELRDLAAAANDRAADDALDQLAGGAPRCAKPGR
jgi:ABC-type branched-subunit amino acid transport system substrate-binding protein